MFQRILVPLDGSSRALQALPVAAHLARSIGGSVIVLRVVSPVLEVEAWPALDFSPPSQLVQSITEGYKGDRRSPVLIILRSLLSISWFHLMVQRSPRRSSRLRQPCLRRWLHCLAPRFTSHASSTPMR